ncbi:hypothetical protein FACS1894204_09970 [Synergistales bacterium]|nr:hypothetical protein FACS1894204_09970 [Synergistales bacterium]
MIIFGIAYFGNIIFCNTIIGITKIGIAFFHILIYNFDIANFGSSVIARWLHADCGGKQQRRAGKDALGDAFD